jgi:hypothetical protein
LNKVSAGYSASGKLQPVDGYTSSEVMRNSSLKLLHNQLKTAKKEINIRSSEIVKLRASVQDLTDQLKLKPANSAPARANSSQPGAAPVTVAKPIIKNATPAKYVPPPSSSSIVSEPVVKMSASSSQLSQQFYRDQVKMLQRRLDDERKQHEKDRKRWDSEKHHVLKYQNRLQDQYTNLVDAFAQVSTAGSQISVAQTKQ